jgi:hypothetical protein
MNKKISLIAAILSAIIFFLYSVVQLLNYALSQGMINTDSAGSFSQLIQFLSSNFKPIIIFLIIALISATSLIYVSFILLSKKMPSKLLKISSCIILTINLTALMLTLLVYTSPAAYSRINFSVNKAEAVLGIAAILFGISFVGLKKLKSPILSSLGILFISQGTVLLTSPFLPIRIVDFTIAINVLEAVFFQNQ